MLIAASTTSFSPIDKRGFFAGDRGLYWHAHTITYLTICFRLKYRCGGLCYVRMHTEDHLMWNTMNLCSYSFRAETLPQPPSSPPVKKEIHAHRF